MKAMVAISRTKQRQDSENKTLCTCSSGHNQTLKVPCFPIKIGQVAQRTHYENLPDVIEERVLDALRSGKRSSWFAEWRQLCKDCLRAEPA